LKRIKKITEPVLKELRGTIGLNELYEELFVKAQGDNSKKG